MGIKAVLAKHVSPYLFGKGVTFGRKFCIKNLLIYSPESGYNDLKFAERDIWRKINSEIINKLVSSLDSSKISEGNVSVTKLFFDFEPVNFGQSKWYLNGFEINGKHQFNFETPVYLGWKFKPRDSHVLD